MSSGEIEWVVSGEVLREPAQGPSSPCPDFVSLSGARLGGRFLVGELLGRGGMGAVYRARDLTSGKEVALKVLLRGDGSQGARALQRFRREARLTAALRHPGIVGVHTAGDLDGWPFIAYELVEAARPLDRAAHGRPLQERVALVRDAARALGHAHAQGVVHRDVKPENLLVDGAGRVRVSDFGLGRAEDAASRITVQGAVMGTPLYMAPEALHGAELDPRADVWALGIVLYLAVSGEHPFQAETLLQLAREVSRGTPRPLRELVPELGRALDDVVARALAPLEQRYPHAGALADDLDAFLRGERPSASAARLPSPRTVRASLIVAGPAALAAAVGLAFVGRPTPTPEPAQEAPAASQTSQATAQAPPPGPPEWWTRLPPRRRAPLPLPEGLVWGAAEGEVLNAKDRSSLRWIPAGRLPGFFLAAHEVTWAHWRAWCAEVGRAPGTASHDGRTQVGDDHPVFDVSLADARAYCAWAGLRLPTLEEWRVAAHPGGAPFPWGSDPDPGRANLNGPDPWPTTSPVGSFPRGATPEGVHDLIGNVWEWVDGERTLSGQQPIVGGCMTSPLGQEWTARDEHHPMSSLGFRVAR